MGKDQDLLDAARKGDFVLVRKLLQVIKKRTGPLSSFRRSPGINIQDINGYTPLHHACLNNHLGIVRLLLANDANPELPDIRRSTPLYLASWAGHTEIVKLLLNTSSVNPNTQTSDNETPLHCAAQHGHNTVLAILLAHGADPSIRNNSFQTPLDLASQFGRLQIVNTLLRTHPELIEQFKVSNLSTSLTKLSLMYDNYSEAHRNASPKKPIFTHSCLHLASRNGHKKVVEALLTAGIDVNILTPSGTALHEAALCGKKSVVSLLLKAGVDTMAVDGNDRTVFDILKDYPPHVTYEITSLIKDFCHLIQSDRYFRPINLMDIKAKEVKTISVEKFNSVPRRKIETSLLFMDEMKYERENDKLKIDVIHHRQSPIITNSSSSLSKSDSISSIAKRASYVPMKPIVSESSSINSSKEKLNYQPVFLKSNCTIEEVKEKEGCNQNSGLFSSPYEMMYLASTRGSSQSSNSSKCEKSENSRFLCIDEYVDMSGTQSTPTPTPKSNDFNFNSYETVNLSDDMKSQTKEQKLPAIKRILSTDANNNKEHSPTPDFPPPSVTTAEKTIYNFMCPQNDKEKRRSFRLNNDDLRELESFFLEKGNISETEDISENVSEYVSDTPFAGLFRGSTLNLASGDDDFLYDRESLRSPSLVKSVLSRRNSLQKSSLKDKKEFSASTTWKEIEDIFEQIDKQVQVKNNETIDLEAEKESLFINEPEQLKRKTSTLSIRKPKELLFSSSDNVTTNWCHSPEALFYNQVAYEVFYLGSTVIRNLQGTHSTRLSIQKLKIDETELEKEADSDADLLNDCTKSTKYLKANNLQTRLAVGIAISYTGVQFIDKETESMICIHSIENINCVCQDSVDLRYFAYITRENDIHYCHVFMVDTLDLAKEIILTLGQAFEVAYQIAMSNNVADQQNALATT